MTFLSKLLDGNLPDAFFILTYNPRASGLYLNGIRSEEQSVELSSYDIDKYLFNPLVDNGKIIIHNNSFFPCRITIKSLDFLFLKSHK